MSVESTVQIDIKVVEAHASIIYASYFVVRNSEHAHTLQTDRPPSLFPCHDRLVEVISVNETFLKERMDPNKSRSKGSCYFRPSWAASKFVHAAASARR